MSAIAISHAISSPNSLCVRKLMTRTRPGNGILFSSIASIATWRSYHSLRPQSRFFRIPNGSSKRSSVFTGSKPLSPVMEWQDCTVKMELDVPISVAYNCYSDREAIPRWMPFISSVKILEDKPDLSRWSLKYEAFDRDFEFTWLARNMQPIPNQKIHWRSLEGLPNRGAVRFYPKGPSSCIVELTVSYEVPQILVPVASALRPLLKRLLRSGLERFATFVKSYQADFN
ncbi:uncharacterized protein LOC109000471 [Juglans regia]|uniref:Uncharacterized protein LOC109000471 n=2 Tax=Juglans regia TaxID=51240 RepID=A0A2I4FMJ7_JUGRE|nr:uncharacterized protein LOC109000471 [Juglans regia]XP_035549226.1 uncharacterized protein LOC109000471 [Juglans regia]